MTVTIFGILVVLIGGWLLLYGSVGAMLVFVMGTSMMTGSAAFVLTNLGGSTMPPASVAMVFLLLRCILPGTQARDRLGDALAANFWLVIFAIYGTASAYLLPRIFAGKIFVTPLRPIPTDDPFVTFPLAFSPQNITVSVYLLLTLAAGLCGYIAARSSGAGFRIARTASVIAIVHAALGFASVILVGTSAEAILEFFRNGFYAQLDQTVQGFVRMNGIAPEPSGYAIFGAGYFIFVTELWLRDVDVRWTRFASLFLLLALLASTSSTAYIALGGYAAVALLRMFLVPGTISSTKLIAFLFLGLLGTIAALTLQLLIPSAGGTILKIASRILFEKAETISGMQRFNWAMQGFYAFRETGGLGIGMGSFRSSSIVTAITGSTGVIGLVSFFGHILTVLKPFRQSTYEPLPDNDSRIGLAASWTVLIMLIPASATAASPDPGITWGLLGGIALALRPVHVRIAARRAALT